jgi:hypothetical protein
VVAKQLRRDGHNCALMFVAWMTARGWAEFSKNFDRVRRGKEVEEDSEPSAHAGVDGLLCY